VTIGSLGGPRKEKDEPDQIIRVGREKLHVRGGPDKVVEGKNEGQG